MAQQEVSILSLPAELLARIFSTHLLSLDAIGDRYPDLLDLRPNQRAVYWQNKRAFSVASRFALVCKTWHTIWMTTPTLWSTVIADFEAYNEELEVSLLRHHSRRSAPAPLDILVWTSGKHKLPKRRLEEVLQFLLSTSYRWRTFVIVGTTAKIASVAFEALAHAPLLEKFDVLYGRNHVERPSSSPVVRLGSSPRLHSARLVTDHLCFQALALPWSQLTSLTLRQIKTGDGVNEITWKDVHEALLHCHRLTSYTCGARRDIVQINAPALVAQLTKLHIFTSRGPGPISFMDSIALPSLRSLVVVYGTQLTADAIECLIERSNCTLTELELKFHTSESSPQGLVRLLTKMPYLAKLVLRPSDGRPLFLQHLLDQLALVEHGCFKLLPALSELYLPQFPEYLIPALVDLLDLRINYLPIKVAGRPRLRVVRVSSFVGREESVAKLNKAKLCEFWEGGVDFQFQGQWIPRM